jgi:exonuclease III
MRRNAEDQISTRFDDVVSVLKTNPTDLICLSEVFHTSVATSFSEELGKKGYHTCHSMGRKPMAPGSGLFFASKFPIQEFTFTPFPPEAKTPRARPAGQGWYEAKVDLGGGRTVTVIGTHLSSSHKPDEPTEVELNARTRAMTLLANRVTDLGKRVILTGDLNLGPEEGHYYEHTFWKEKNLFTTDKNPDIENQPTWMGDKCYSEVASAPVRLDFTKVGVGAGFGNTHVIEVSYNPHRLDPTSVSDHRPIHTLVELS